MPNDWVKCEHCDDGINEDSVYVYQYGQYREKTTFEVECYYCKGVGEVFVEDESRAPSLGRTPRLPVCKGES